MKDNNNTYTGEGDDLDLVTLEKTNKRENGGKYWVEKTEKGM